MNKAREIRRELARLRRRYRWEQAHGFVKDPGTGKDLFQVCSWTAAIFAWEFGGKLVGYTHEREKNNRANNTAIVVAKGLGHDFCLVDDRWLIDFWAWTGHCLPFRERDLYDLADPRDDGVVSALYGDRSTWMPTQEWVQKGWGDVDFLGECLWVVVRKLGYEIKINGGLPFTERIESANEKYLIRTGQLVGPIALVG